KYVLLRDSYRFGRIRVCLIPSSICDAICVRLSPNVAKLTAICINLFSTSPQRGSKYRVDEIVFKQVAVAGLDGHEDGLS
ncbi:TPA: hypothetical protein U1X05_002162, partial [Streptococcus suis]|nr:hypothetical protein [Streptococcus suis]